MDAIGQLRGNIAMVMAAADNAPGLGKRAAADACLVMFADLFTDEEVESLRSTWQEGHATKLDIRMIGKSADTLAALREFRREAMA